jgi:hypothetical protein
LSKADPISSWKIWLRSFTGAVSGWNLFERLTGPMPDCEAVNRPSKYDVRHISHFWILH